MKINYWRRTHTVYSAQMNPHFMFNVLSMISMRLKMNGDEELYKMVSAFSGLDEREDIPLRGR